MNLGNRNRLTFYIDSKKYNQKDKTKREEQKTKRQDQVFCFFLSSQFCLLHMQSTCTSTLRMYVAMTMCVMRGCVQFAIVFLCSVLSDARVDGTRAMP
jgi:hypothetical protein